MRVKILVKTALLLAIMVVCSLVTIPIGAIPMTLQVFAVALAGYLMGVNAIFVVFVYLILGMMGVPIFSSFSAGLASLVGPSGGYLIGFLILALGSGLSRGRGWRKVILRTGIAIILLYTCGIIGYSLSTGVDIVVATVMNIWYLPKDVVLVVLAYIVAKRLDSILKE